MLLCPLIEQAQTDQSATQQERAPALVPPSTDIFGRDIYHYVGHDIAIQESIDYFGAVMWPAVSTTQPPQVFI